MKMERIGVTRVVPVEEAHPDYIVFTFRDAVEQLTRGSAYYRDTTLDWRSFQCEIWPSPIGLEFRLRVNGENDDDE